jgi:hypothetical protein
MQKHHNRLDKIEASAEGRPTVYQIAHLYAEGAVPDDPMKGTFTDREEMDAWKENLPSGVEPIVIEYAGPMPETNPPL